MVRNLLQPCKFGPLLKICCNQTEILTTELFNLYGCSMFHIHTLDYNQIKPKQYLMIL